MSINMYVSSSQRQASSASNMCKQQIQGYEQLQKAINDFTMNSPFLTGKAYDSAKKYFSSVLYPLAQAGILLSEAVERSVKKFPETYVAQVDSGDLKQAELEMKIREVNALLLQAENIQSNLMSLNVPDLVGMKTAQLSANSTLIFMYRGVKKKLEEKLQKLLAFNASSPHIFSEIASLQQAVNQGLAQTKTAWNASSGTFTIPSSEALSWTKGIQEKWKDYVERHEPKIEVRVQKIDAGLRGEFTKYEVYVDGILDKDKTNELMWMVTNQSIGQTIHLVGDFALVNDIYRLIMGEDWLSKEKSNRVEAAGWLGLALLPYSKLTNIATEIRAGNKLLKGVALSADELKILNDAGYFDKVIKVENVAKASGLTNTQKIERFQNRINDIRNKMPNSKLKNQGNMAAADVNIKGLPDEFIAHSKIHGPNSKGADVGNFSPASENRIFKSYTVDKFPRYNDTEAKILEDIASRVKDPNISGKIDLYTELPACQSCTNVILEFRKSFPNIKLNIFTK
ncbi:deaminase domain-containing protein [Bacillus sp. LK2]|uniref:deaminase domain-containing protein n=1 Tax=Bacillus sp. LK2 TaxID=1628206 RepID=UPI00069D2319|nr:deaminase domain-containing protein [Bacillus sp. LK2]